MWPAEVVEKTLEEKYPDRLTKFDLIWITYWTQNPKKDFFPRFVMVWFGVWGIFWLIGWSILVYEQLIFDTY